MTAALLQSAAAALLPWVLLGLIAEVIDLVATRAASRRDRNG